MSKKGKASETYKAKTQVEAFRESMRPIMIGGAIISVYATGLLEGLFRGRHSFYTLGSVLSSFFTSPATLLLFPALLAAMTGIAVAVVNKTWEEARREDKLQRGFLHAKDGAPYGDAHFEEPWEFIDAAQIRPVEKCKGKILGQLDDEGRLCVDFNPYEGRINSHMVAIGRSGGGKTFTFVKTFLMQAMKQRHSVFVADPKGDLYRETSSYFRDNGYVVRKLDLKNLQKSDGWHCLGSLHGVNLITNAQIFSSTVMANISERDDVYSRAGGSLLTALILRVLQGKEYPPEKKNIKTVHELLQDSGGIDFLDSLLSGEGLAEDEEDCSRFYQDFKRASGNLAGNIITHLATGIQLLNNRLIGDILSTDDIDLTLPGQVPCVYYINFPDTDVTFKFIISLFFSMAFINLVDYADIHTKDGKLPVPVDFLLDEFPALGVIPDWDRKIATVRSRQINLVMIIQDVPQLKKRYLESWATILNNCGVLLTLGINEPSETAPYISQRIGETSIEVISTSESEFMDHKDPFVSRSSVGVGKREFLSVSEVCEISRDGSLILFADHQPVYTNKFPFILHPDADKLEDTLPENVVDFNDREGRKLYRQIEKEYREQFWKTHHMHPNLKYKDISDALLADPPQDPMSMLISMLRDDFQIALAFIKKKIHELKKDKDESAPPVEEKEDAIEVDAAAEKGSFQRFYENYLKQKDDTNSISTYGDLSVEIDQSTGEVLSIVDNSYIPTPQPKESSKVEVEKTEEKEDCQPAAAESAPSPAIQPAAQTPVKKKSSSFSQNPFAASQTKEMRDPNEGKKSAGSGSPPYFKSSPNS